ncbi:MAG: 3-deoxy-manno-octulosonate cytidylyltransferase [Bacteroidetes bacterium]|nr:3-deoxy-manno-octulosonate cytidylyltransferase [Bacteroidota bacterium]
MIISIIIPARFASTRLPGKPLALIGDKPMILHVVKQALNVRGIDSVWVATDHEDVFSVVTKAGFNAVMTREDHQSGTDRLAEANEKIGADIVVNIQGDEPFIDPETIENAIAPLLENADLDMSTLATVFRSDEEIENPNFPKVIVDSRSRALYFSRSVVPFHRDKPSEWLGAYPYLRHIGLYVYRAEILKKLSSLKPVPLEVTEKLEQLRALYHGISIGVVQTGGVALSVDTPEDLELARTYYQSKQKSK